MAKCNCNHCGQHIEFDDLMVGAEVACPSCGKDTKLFLPGGVVPEPLAPLEITAPSPPAPNIQMGNAAVPTGSSDPAKGLGIASMILGICSITIVPCLATIPAIVCGHISRKKSKQSNTLPSGMALTGLITGYLGLIPLIIMSLYILAAIATPNFSKMRSDAQKTACHAQLRQIDGTKEMWATQEKRADGDTPSKSQLGLYFKDGMPTCPGGGSYNIAPVGTYASCSIHAKLY
jgi:competence protein ComGC